MKILALSLFVSLLFITSCTNQLPSSTSVGTERGTIAITINKGSSFNESVVKATVFITCENKDTISQALTITETTITGTVKKIPTGTWLFEIMGYDKEGTVLYRGSATATISIDEITPVTIILKAATGSAVINGSIEENDDPALVLYFPFSGDAKDQSGYENHGVVHGAALTTDRLGNEKSAYHFDGIDDYIEVKTESSLDISDQMTISFWYNFEMGGSKNPRVIHKHQNFEVFTASTAAERKMCFGVNYNGPSDDGYTFVTPTFSAGKWYHVVCIANGSQRTVYVNGSKVTDSETEETLLNKSYRIFIGANGEVGNSADFFKGTIDELRIYSRALTKDECLNLYDQ